MEKKTKPIPKLPDIYSKKISRNTEQLHPVHKMFTGMLMVNNTPLGLCFSETMIGEVMHQLISVVQSCMIRLFNTNLKSIIGRVETDFDYTLINPCMKIFFNGLRFSDYVRLRWFQLRTGTLYVNPNDINDPANDKFVTKLTQAGMEFFKMYVLLTEDTVLMQFKLCFYHWMGIIFRFCTKINQYSSNKLNKSEIWKFSCLLLNFWKEIHNLIIDKQKIDEIREIGM